MDSFWSHDQEAEDMLAKLRPPKLAPQEPDRRGWLARVVGRRRT
jgi:hypothetical protein